ncbi:hypothetical protein [Paenibacillus chitinolyticus]
MQYTVPTVRANVTLITAANGPRNISPGTYRPHIVLESVTQRLAIRYDRAALAESYAGVAFVNGPERLCPGESAEVELALMYYPTVNIQTKNWWKYGLLHL